MDDPNYKYQLKVPMKVYVIQIRVMTIQALRFVVGLLAKVLHDPSHKRAAVKH